MYKVFKQPISISSNFYSHQDGAKHLSRHQQNPMFRVPNQYYTAKKNSRPPKYHTNHSQAETKQNFTALKTDPFNDSIEQEHHHRMQTHNWAHSSKTRQNIQQLRSSVQSLQKMIEKSQQILKNSSKKSFASNIKQSQAKKQVYSKVRSDSINIKLRTQSSLGSSIESRKTKRSVKKESDKNIPNETNNFNRGILYTKNRVRTQTQDLSSLQHSRNVKRKIVFNPQTFANKTYLSNNNIGQVEQRKPKHIMTFQKAQKDYKFEFAQQQNSLENLEVDQKSRNQLRKQTSHKKHLRDQVREQSSKRKNFSSLTVDLDRNQIDYSKDKIRIQDGIFSPINNKVNSPTAYSSFSGWHSISDHKSKSSFKSMHKNINFNQDRSFQTDYKDFAKKSLNQDQKTDKLAKLNQQRQPIQDPDTVDFKIERTMVQNTDNQQPIYFTGKNLSRYYHQYNQKKAQQTPVFGSDKGKYSIFPQNNNSSSRKIAKSYLEKNYQSNNQSYSAIKKREQQFLKNGQSCSKYSRNSDRYRREHFIKKLQKYTFVQKYLTNRQIGSIYEGLKKTDIPQTKWILIVIDEVYKKMQQMNKIVHTK